MTVTPFPGMTGNPMLTAVPTFDIERILASIDTMAAQRPVAAQIVSVANSDDTSAKALSTILSSDVALASRVMKLANSAYFGMRGRVTSLQSARWRRSR
jgi:HD-like signal output (HDOD) protein